MCLSSDGASHRLCVENIYLCSVCSCVEHHTILIFEACARRRVFVDIVRFSVCKEVLVIIIVSIALSGSVMNIIPPGYGEDRLHRGQV